MAKENLEATEIAIQHDFQDSVSYNKNPKHFHNNSEQTIQPDQLRTINLDGGFEFNRRPQNLSFARDLASSSQGAYNG